jgi:glycyl-tRNA synthetase (class II)
VTVRDRDSLAQERIALGQAGQWLDDALARDWTTPKAG